MIRLYIWQTSHMPFGGVGNSGMGGGIALEREADFDTFTHAKSSIMKKSVLLDIPMPGAAPFKNKIEYIKEADVGHYAQIRKDIEEKKGSGSNADAFSCFTLYLSDQQKDMMREQKTHDPGNTESLNSPKREW